MSRKIHCPPCNCQAHCEPGSPNENQRPASARNPNTRSANDYQRFGYPSSQNVRNFGGYGSSCPLGQETVEALEALRQRACCLRSEFDAMSEPYHTNANPPRQAPTAVRRQVDLIDYTPESEFLRRMKQQCEYLRNNEENIFSALDQLGIDEYFADEYIKPREPYPSGDRVKARPTTAPSQKTISYRPEKSIREFETDEEIRDPLLLNQAKLPVDSIEVTKARRLQNRTGRKSEHVSRSKKPSYYRGRRKRASSEKTSTSSEYFEPTLKRPHEDSCERCWRYASPTRSPVNKPDQKFDPNFRKAHSTPDFEKAEQDFEDSGRPHSPYGEPINVSERRKTTLGTEIWRKSDAALRRQSEVVYHAPEQQRPVQEPQPPEQPQPFQQQQSFHPQTMRGMARPASAYTYPQPNSGRERHTWKSRSPPARETYQHLEMGPVMPPSKQHYDHMPRTVPNGVSRSQTKMPDLMYEYRPSKSTERNVKRPEMPPSMKYQNFYPDAEKLDRPKRGIPGYPRTYRSNIVGDCLQQNFTTPFKSKDDAICRANNLQRQQARPEEPQSSFIDAGLFCYRDQAPSPCRCCGLPLPPQPEPCPPDVGYLGGRSQDDRFQGEHPPAGSSPDRKRPSTKGKSTSGRSPSGRSPSGRSPSGRSPGGRQGSTSDGLPAQQGGMPNRQGRAESGAGTQKTPPTAYKTGGIPHTDSTVYAELEEPEDQQDDLKSNKKGPTGSASPKGGKSKRDKAKSLKNSSSSTDSKAGGKSGKMSKSPKSKSPKSPKSPKLSGAQGEGSKSPKARSKSPRKGSSKSPRKSSSNSPRKSSSKSPRKSSSKSPSLSSKSKSSPKSASRGGPTTQTAQAPPNEKRCTYDPEGRLVCPLLGEYSGPQAYSSNRIQIDQYKGPHMIRECYCSTRQQSYGKEGSLIRGDEVDYLLCCHCGMNKSYHNQNNNPCPPGPSRFPVNSRPPDRAVDLRTLCPEQGRGTRNVGPEMYGPRPSDDLDDYVQCPYKPSVRLWSNQRNSEKPMHQSQIRSSSREPNRPSQPPFSYNNNPKTYFVFHMTRANPDKGDDTEVLVEETTLMDPNRKEERTQDITEKMKKIMECPSDSMALRFQKGVSESCKPPQSSRVLYF